MLRGACPKPPRLCKSGQSCELERTGEDIFIRASKPISLVAEAKPAGKVPVGLLLAQSKTWSAGSDEEDCGWQAKHQAGCCLLDPASGLGACLPHPDQRTLRHTSRALILAVSKAQSKEPLVRLFGVLARLTHFERHGHSIS